VTSEEEASGQTELIREEFEGLALGRDTGARVAQSLQILGIHDPQGDGGAGLHNEFTVESTFSLYGDLLAQRGESGPLFFFIDGAHWLAGESRKALIHLIASLEKAPAMILLTSRNTAPKSLENVHFQSRELPPLSESEGLKLCWSLMEGVENLDEKVSTTLLGRSGGLPGLLEDLVTLLVQRGIIVKTSQGGFRCLPGRMEEASLPDTMGESSEARMEALQSRERKILEMAVVFGERFWSGGVERLLRHEERGMSERWWEEDVCKMRFRQVALELQSRGIIVFEQNSVVRGQAEFRFRRESDQRYLNDSMPVLRRALYSRMAGRWLLEVIGDEGNGAIHEVAANLLLNGGVHREAGAAWRAAGDAARAAQASARSIQSYAKARECFGTEFATLASDATMASARSRLYLGDLDGAVGEAGEAVRLAGVEGYSSQGVRAFVLQAGILRLRGEYGKASECLDSAKEVWSKIKNRETNDTQVMIQAELEDQEGRLVLECGGKNAFSQSEAHFEYAVSLRRQLGDSRRLSAALRYLARVRFEQDIPEKAQSLFEEALALSMDEGDLVGQAASYLGLARTSLEVGVLEKAQGYVSSGLDCADKAGARLQSTQLLNLKGEIDLMGGHFKPAEMALAEATSAAEDMGVRRVLVEVLVNRTLLSFAFGNGDQAMEWCEQGMTLAEEIDSRPLRVLVLRARGIILAGVDKPRAMSAFNRASALLTAMGAKRQLKTIDGLKTRLEG